jgi:hypothetical protein
MGYCYSKFMDGKMCGGMQLSDKQMMLQDCCCTGPTGSSWENQDDQVCEGCPLHGTPAYKKLCPGGPSTTTDEFGRIKKHDGCKMLSKYCMLGKCIETGDRGVKCECKPGYKFNNDLLDCEEINECKESPLICGHEAMCTNTDGSYVCTCAKGHTFDPVRKFCEDKRVQSCFRMVGPNAAGECVKSSVQTTKQFCCCGAVKGNRYGDMCALCPPKNSPAGKVICGGKPTLAPFLTGQAPIGPTRPPTIDPARIVTDEAGNPVTDETGNIVTLPKPRPTEIVYVTDESGNPVTDESGEAITQIVTVPPPKTEIVHVTDADGNLVTDSSGNIVTKIVVKKPTEAPIVVVETVTDESGNAVTDASGNVVTRTYTV